MSTFAGVSFCGPRVVAVRLFPVDYQDRYRWCCYAAAEDGPAACTCWEPIYDAEQAEPRTDVVPETRSQMCGDCAYRPDSPERAGDPYFGLALTNFWCHRGIRRPRWRHPDGRVRPGDPADYQPPVIDGVPYRADGLPAARCGGWAGRSDLMSTVRTTARLSAHQLDTLRLYDQLGSYQAVADFRGVADKSVGQTLAIVRRKLGVATTAEAVAWLHDLGAAT